MPKQTIPGNAVPIATRTVRLPGSPRLGNTQRARWHVALLALVRRRKKAHGDGSQKLSGREAEGTKYPAARAAPLMSGREADQDKHLQSDSREKGRSYGLSLALRRRLVLWR
jgi:hypothetical protein